MNKHQMNSVLDKAEIVLRERGFISIERRTERTEFSSDIIYIVAKNEIGQKAEAYPRNTRDGMTYVIHQD